MHGQGISHHSGGLRHLAAGGFTMKLEAATFLRLRRLAPVLDDVLGAGEVEHADQALGLASLAQLCTQLFDAYYEQRPDEIAQVRLEALEPQSRITAGAARFKSVLDENEHVLIQRPLLRIS
jgi:hypothetical protein